MGIAVIVIGILIQVVYCLLGAPDLYKSCRKILYNGTESNRRKQGYRRRT
jgi:hypothetical protein